MVLPYTVISSHIMVSSNTKASFQLDCVMLASKCQSQFAAVLPLRRSPANADVRFSLDRFLL